MINLRIKSWYRKRAVIVWHKKKIRGKKRIWKSMKRDILAMAKDPLVEDVYIVPEFEEWPSKVSKKYRIELVETLIEALHIKKSLVTGSEKVLAWIELTRLSNSAVSVYQSQEQLDNFLRSSKEDVKEDLLGFSFSFHRAETDQVSEDYSYLLDVIKEDSLLLKGKDAFEHDEYGYENERFYVVLGDIEGIKHIIE